MRASAGFANPNQLQLVEDALRKVREAENAIRCLLPGGGMHSWNESQIEFDRQVQEDTHWNGVSNGTRNGTPPQTRNHPQDQAIWREVRDSTKGVTPVSADTKKGKFVPDAVVIHSEESHEEYIQDQQNLKDEDIKVTIVWAKWRALRLPFFHPESSRMLTWLTIGILFIFIDAIFIPYQLAFQVQAEGDTLRWVVDVYFLLDILVSFFSSFTDQYGELVLDPPRIWKGYLKSWFAFDVLAAFPWKAIERTADGPASLTRGLRVVRMVRLMRIMRILRIFKMGKVIEKLEHFAEGNYFMMFSMGVLRVLVNLFVVCHWCSCLWFSTTAGVPSDDPNWVDIKLPSETSVLDRLEHHSEFYMWSLYFTMTTMTTVGYGDISPTNQTECKYALLFLGISAVVFAGQLGVLSDLIQNMNVHAKIMREQKTALARYMNWREVPRRLRRSIRAHCIYLWETNEGNDAYEDELKEILPPVLKRELCDHIYGGVIRNAPFLAWMADFPPVVKYLASAIENTFWEKGDYLFRYDELNKSILLLLTGQVKLTRNEAIDFVPAETRMNTDCVFSVPRKGKKSVSEMTAQMLKQKQKLALSKSQDMPGSLEKQKTMNAAIALNATMGQLSQTTDQEMPMTFDHEHLSNAQIFGSSGLVHAKRMMRKTDRQQTQAAKVLQQKYKQKQEGKVYNTASTFDGDWNRRIAVHSMRSHSIKAPAFFGESCLWYEGFEKGHFQARHYGYSAMCEQLCETLAIAPANIYDLFERFAPWLEARFVRFQEELKWHYDPSLERPHKIKKHKEGRVPKDDAMHNFENDAAFQSPPQEEAALFQGGLMNEELGTFVGGKAQSEAGQLPTPDQAASRDSVEGGVFANMAPATQDQVNTVSTSAGSTGMANMQDQVVRTESRNSLGGYKEQAQRDRGDTTSSIESRNVFFQDPSFCAPCKMPKDPANAAIPISARYTQAGLSGMSPESHPRAVAGDPRSIAGSPRPAGRRPTKEAMLAGSPDAVQCGLRGCMVVGRHQS